jgi:hypothetical protein
VTKEGSPGFVPQAERIALFDNDGTLWAEQPVYFQLQFALDRVKAMAPPFIVSGGGVEFMRAFAEKTYGVRPEQVVGSQGKLKYEVRGGKPVLVKLPEIQFIDDKEGKPAAIQTFIGRRPIAAFGNSDGDKQMLEWTTAGPGVRFALIVHHDDAEREWPTTASRRSERSTRPGTRRSQRGGPLCA